MESSAAPTQTEIEINIPQDVISEAKRLADMSLGPLYSSACLTFVHDGKHFTIKMERPCRTWCVISVRSNCGTLRETYGIKHKRRRRQLLMANILYGISQFLENPITLRPQVNLNII